MTPSRGGSCLTTLRKLVMGLARLISLGALSGQLGQRPFDVTPDAAQRDAEDSLATAEQIDHLIVGGALEDRHAITHQGDLSKVLDTAGTQMLDRGTNLLQRNAGIDQPLDHL